ncbi:VOC family protein [Aquirufa regiilacus]
MPTPPSQQIFINLPVANLQQSQLFYEALGFRGNPTFTGEDQKCMVWSDQIFVMLQSHTFSNKHAQKSIADFQRVTGPSFTLPLESVGQVNLLVEKGLKAGGSTSIPMVDEGFMQVRTIEDPDGYSWGLMYLDIQKFNSRN